MSILDSIDNFYERLVVEVLEGMPEHEEWTEDFTEDVVCVALNRLPPRYYRHSVDMVFYLADQELVEMKRRVREVVKDAMEFVLTHQRA